MERIWWEKVPNALALSSDTADAMLDEKSILIYSSHELPWRNDFREIVMEAVREENFSKSWLYTEDEEEPGEFIFRKCCKTETKAVYRPSKSCSKFLAERDESAMHERFFWVRIQSEKMLNDWMDFVSDYLKNRDKNKEKAIFVLEWMGDTMPPSKKGIRVFSFDDYIGDYDRFVFSMLAASNTKELPFIKNYMAELSANLTDNDIELSAECLKRYEEFLNAPSEVLYKIAEEECRSSGEAFAFHKSDEKITYGIWLSQIRTIYPLLEEYREKFIKQYKEELRELRTIKGSYGTVYNTPDDFELGVLAYLVEQGKLSISYEEYQKLAFCKNARNTLSHLGVLSFEEIKRIVKRF